MAKYRVTANERSDVPNRDAYAVSVRVVRDGEDLGLWQTWISGPSDMAIDRHGAITKSQRRRIAAELLAAGIESAVRSGTIRTRWQAEIEVLDVTPHHAIAAYADRTLRAVPDFQPGDLIREFDI